MPSRPQQHIFVLECSESSGSDWNYVRKLLASKYFKLDFSQVRLRPVYLGGKANYASDHVKKELSNCISRYAGKTFVHFVFDVDRGLSKDKALNNDISSYVEKLELPKNASKDIIWFNKTIESVLLGHGVADGKKVQSAIAFYTMGHYELSEKNMDALSDIGQSHPGRSNFLTTLYESIPMGSKAVLLKAGIGNKARRHSKKGRD